MLAGANLANQFAADVSGVASMRMKAASGDPATLRAVASQFEAILVQTMLKSARSSSLAGEDDIFGKSTDMQLYRDLMDQQWAQNIVSGKGLGLADILVKRLGQGGAAAATVTTGQDAHALRTEAKPVPIDVDALRTLESPARSQTSDRSGEPADDAGQPNGDDSSPGDRKQRFIQAMLPHAQAAEQATGIPARFMLAQAGLESGWGQREIKNEDGSTSHNLFGIKAGGSWGGQAVDTLTTEYKQGLAMKVSAKFRAYADYAEAFVDYANLLKRRYRGVVEAGNDAQAFVRGIVDGGYATDPAYGSKLAGTIRSVAAAGV